MLCWPQNTHHYFLFGGRLFQHLESAVRSTRMHSQHNLFFFLLKIFGEAHTYLYGLAGKLRGPMSNIIEEPTATATYQQKRQLHIALLLLVLVTVLVLS
jgi:hypothetical protein